MNAKLSTKTTNQQWAERWKKSSMQNYGQPTVAFERGQGSWLWDVEGRKYLDFAAGVAVCSTGHAHPTIVNAIQEQASKLLHTSNLYLIPNQIELAEELVGLSGLQQAFFCNSGTEAVEAAMKLARFWGSKNGGRTEFITMGHAFHGRTLGALTLTRNPRYQQGFEPLLPGVVEVPYDDIEAVRKAITSKTCAVIVEPIQGEGGVHVPGAGYLSALRKVCDEKGVLLILDEVQTGIGRTGEWFAFQHSKATPDILALAKGLGSGFPIGATLANERAAAFQPGSHGSTFGGNPLACAAALATLRVIRDEKLLLNARTQGKALRTGLERIGKGGSIGGIRGMGLLCGFDLAAGSSKEFAKRLLGSGLLVSNIGDRTVRLAPPLTVSSKEVETACTLLLDGLASNSVAPS